MPTKNKKIKLASDSTTAGFSSFSGDGGGGLGEGCTRYVFG